FSRISPSPLPACRRCSLPHAPPPPPTSLSSRSLPLRHHPSRAPSLHVPVHAAAAPSLPTSIPGLRALVPAVLTAPVAVVLAIAPQRLPCHLPRAPDPRFCPGLRASDPANQLVDAAPVIQRVVRRDPTANSPTVRCRRKPPLLRHRRQH
ncbi:hypothetical protein BRADI_3g30106v3, partial [Brachypodium distachyon]